MNKILDCVDDYVLSKLSVFNGAKKIIANADDEKTYSQVKQIFELFSLDNSDIKYHLKTAQMEKTLIIPTFGIKEDDIAVKQLETIFAGQKIATIESNEIANDGGILNCITWNILK